MADDTVFGWTSEGSSKWTSVESSRVESLSVIHCFPLLLFFLSVTGYTTSDVSERERERMMCVYCVRICTSSDKGAQGKAEGMGFT
jgi:hypothetical protein